jgi:hypothetical protein
MSETLSELESIDALAAERSPEAATRLRDIAETTAEREIRKAARRALFRLSQAGILPSVQKAEVEKRPSRTQEAETLRAFASAFDGAGNRLLFFVLTDPDGGSPTLVQVFANDEEGIKDCDDLRMPRREVEERIGRFEQQLENGLALAEIEGDYGRWLLSRGRLVNQRLGRATPAGFLTWAGRIGEPQTRYETSAIYAHISADEIQADPSIPHDAGALFALPWFDAWFFTAEEVGQWLPDWKQAASSVVVLPESAVQARRLRVLKEAVGVLMTPPVRERYVVRLEESADVLRRRGKETAARQALYQALKLKAEEAIEESPFAQALVQRTIEAALEVDRPSGTKEEETERE